MTTLEKFYYGNIIPHEIPIVQSSECDTANRLVVLHDESLIATLTDQQKEIFQKFKNKYKSDLAIQSPHRRFVAVCGRRKAPPDIMPGGAAV